MFLDLPLVAMGLNPPEHGSNLKANSKCILEVHMLSSGQLIYNGLRGIEIDISVRRNAADLFACQRKPDFFGKATAHREE